MQVCDALCQVLPTASAASTNGYAAQLPMEQDHQKQQQQQQAAPITAVVRGKRKRAGRNPKPATAAAIADIQQQLSNLSPHVDVKRLKAAPLWRVHQAKSELAGKDMVSQRTYTRYFNAARGGSPFTPASAAPAAASRAAEPPVMATMDLRKHFVDILLGAPSTFPFASFDTANIKGNIMVKGRVVELECHMGAVVGWNGAVMFGLLPPISGAGTGNDYETEDFLQLVLRPLVEKMQSGKSTLLPALHKSGAGGALTPAAAEALTASSLQPTKPAPRAPKRRRCEPAAAAAPATPPPPQASTPQTNASWWPALPSCGSWWPALPSCGSPPPASPAAMSLEALALQLYQYDLLLPAREGPPLQYEQQQVVLLLDGAPEHTAYVTAAKIREAGRNWGMLSCCVGNSSKGSATIFKQPIR